MSQLSQFALWQLTSQYEITNKIHFNVSYLKRTENETFQCIMQN